MMHTPLRFCSDICRIESSIGFWLTVFFSYYIIYGSVNMHNLPDGISVMHNKKKP